MLRGIHRTLKPNKYSFIPSIRAIHSAASLCGRRGKIPWNIKFPIFPDDVAADKEGGREDLPSIIAKTDPFYPQQPGYTDDQGRFHVVKEMIPDFVVPDLTDFRLKPYVSYRVPEVKQGEFTAEDLFRATYGQQIVLNFKDKKISFEDLENVKQTGDLQNVSTKKS